MSRSFRLQELARLIDATVVGDPDREVSGIATLADAGPDDLSFLTNPKYRQLAGESRAGVLLVGPESGVSGRDMLVARQPYAALAVLLGNYYPEARPPAGVSADARVAGEASLGQDVHVGPFAWIGAGARIADQAIIDTGAVIGADCAVGERTWIHPRAVLYPGTQVGQRCVIHAGVVLGADGYGFATVEGEHRKVPQVGRVVVEDDVEIGANTTVDRAMLGDTRIGAGSKIDDLVMIAHGVQIGPGALLAGQAGVAGSTRLGSHATLAGQVGVAGHLELGDGVIVAAKSAVFENLADRTFAAGIPATDARSWKRSVAVSKRLPELSRELRDLRRRVEELERDQREEG